jgi:hypothetical protein
MKYHVVHTRVLFALLLVFGVLFNTLTADGQQGPSTTFLPLLTPAVLRMHAGGSASGIWAAETGLSLPALFPKRLPSPTYSPRRILLNIAPCDVKTPAAAKWENFSTRCPFCPTTFVWGVKPSRTLVFRGRPLARNFVKLATARLGTSQSALWL